jgi:peptide/nickel transport system ATP-binding protein
MDEKIKAGKAGFLTKYYKGIYQRMLSNPRALSLQIISRIPILRRYKRILNEEAKKEAINMLRIMRIPDPERVVDMYPHELSGGMAQRVVIAIALACNPQILIADEPTTNLDVTVQLQILRLIKELKEKIASSIIYVTHDMGIIAEMCDRVAVMYAGNVVELSSVSDIFKKPLHPYTQGLLQSIPRYGVPFKSIEGTVPSLIDPPKGCRFHNRCCYAMDVCAKVKPKAVEVEKEHFVECFLYE